jgi:hypothetical protein
VALNVTVISAGSNGFFTLYPGPSGTARPDTSTINFSAGKTRANNAVIRLGSDGSINVANSSAVTQGFVIDLMGYFK